MDRTSQLRAGTYLILRTRWDCSMNADSFVTQGLQWEGQNETLRSGGAAGSARETPPGLVLTVRLSLTVSKGRRLEHKGRISGLF